MDQRQNAVMEEHWMPFTANRDFRTAPRILERADGVYYFSADGARVIDACSALFTTPLGHGRAEIIEAITRQLGRLDYSPHFQVGHPGSFEAAARVARITPKGLGHIFFVNSGSEAVDTAMKMVMAYHRARGTGSRQFFVSRERAYHGVNIGGTSLSGMVANRNTFYGLLPHVVHMRHTWNAEQRFCGGQPEDGAELADDLLRHVQNLGAENIAACFVEPVAGSTGVLVPPTGYLERLREICDAHGILLVFDEVICGFGRLGTPFGAQAFGVVPDIMTMAKALTNGLVPMGAVAASDKVHDTIMNAAPEGAVELFHGYTYSAHPLACAAAIATLDIYESENLFARAADMSGYFRRKVWTLKDHEAVFDIRVCGMLAGVELYPDGAPGRRGLAATKALFNAGMHIKFTGDTGILAPAFVCEEEHIDEMVEKLGRALDRI